MLKKSESIAGYANRKLLYIRSQPDESYIAIVKLGLMPAHCASASKLKMLQPAIEVVNQEVEDPSSTYYNRRNPFSLASQPTSGIANLALHTPRRMHSIRKNAVRFAIMYCSVQKGCAGPTPTIFFIIGSIPYTIPLTMSSLLVRRCMEIRLLFNCTSVLLGSRR